MTQILENGKKPISWVLSLLDITRCFSLLLCAISGKTNEVNLRKWPKTNFRPDFVSFAQIWATKLLFFLNLVFSVTRYHQLSSCTISEKANDPILRKVSDGRTSGWTNEQTDRRRTEVVSLDDAVRLTSSVQK